MATRIKLRRNLTSYWNTNNPTLEDGEPIVGFDSEGKAEVFKIGPGAWNSLDNLLAGTGEGGGTYDLESPTTTTVGLMPSGSNITGLTWQEIIQWITTGIGPVVGGEILWGSTVELMGSTILTFAS